MLEGTITPYSTCLQLTIHRKKMNQDVEKMNSDSSKEQQPATTIQEEIENLVMAKSRLDLPTSVNQESISTWTLKILNQLFIDEQQSNQFKTKYVLLIKSNHNEFVNYFIQQIQQSKYVDNLSNC